MIKHFSKQFFTILICCLIGFSTSYAQGHYVGGNNAISADECKDLPGGMITIPYVGGNNALPAEICIKGIFKSVSAPTRSACNGGGGAQFAVELFDGTGTYAFWWESSPTGTRNNPLSWTYIVTNPGSGTFSVPSAARPIGPSVTDQWLYAYLVNKVKHHSVT